MQPVQNEGIGIVERSQIQRGQLMPEPLLLKVEDAAYKLSLSRTKVYELMESGQLTSIKIGTARRIPRTALDEYIARQLQES